MPHSSGLGRKAVSLPRQTSDVFLLWLSSTLPGIILQNGWEVCLFSWHDKDVFVWDGLKRVQSSCSQDCRKNIVWCFFFLSAWLSQCQSYLHNIAARMFSCLPIPVASRRILCAWAIFAFAATRADVPQVFNKGKMFALLSTWTAWTQKASKFHSMTPRGCGWLHQSSIPSSLPPF